MWCSLHLRLFLGYVQIHGSPETIFERFLWTLRLLWLNRRSNVSSVQDMGAPTATARMSKSSSRLVHMVTWDRNMEVHTLDYFHAIKLRESGVFVWDSVGALYMWYLDESTVWNSVMIAAT